MNRTIVRPIVDDTTSACIGYTVVQAPGLWLVYDADGRFTTLEEAPLPSPLIDPVHIARCSQGTRLDNHTLSYRLIEGEQKMFEIKNEDLLFRLSFIERIEEPEEPQEDAIMCWLEINGCNISLQCQCELTPYDLESLKSMISDFYHSLYGKRPPEDVRFSPRMEAFTCGFNLIGGSDLVGFTFSASPHVYDSWKLTGGIIIDQSYFPALILGIESILTN